MTVPLVVRHRALGAITFIAAESGRRYGDADLSIALDLARRAATAVDNALLYREAILKETQVRFLAEAGGILSELLDYDATLAALARLAVPRIADWCIVDVVDGAEIRRAAVAAARRGQAACARAAPRALPTHVGLAATGGTCAARGRPRDFRGVPFGPARRDRWSTTGISRSCGYSSPHSAIAMPLVARGDQRDLVSDAMPRSRPGARLDRRTRCRRPSSPR